MNLPGPTAVLVWVKPKSTAHSLFGLAATAAILSLSAPAGAAMPAASADPVPGRSQSATQLPDLGSGANAMLSREDEYQIGRMMLRTMREESRLLQDPETDEYLQSLGSRIGVEAQDGEQRLTFFAVRDSGINAFAIPGGFVGTNADLILKTESESELAGVVAHEIGHVVQRHMARAYQSQSRNSLTSIAATLGAVLVGALTGSSDAGLGLLAMAQGAAMQQQINFTRMEEHEADRVGIGYLSSAGFDPQGMTGFFGTLMRERGISNDLVPRLLMTHPADAVRLGEARARIASMPPAKRRPDSANYALIRERLRVIASPAEQHFRQHYASLLQSHPDHLAYRYGAALAELKAGDANAAASQLKLLVERHPDLPLLHSALGQALAAAGRGPEAREVFERGLKVSPRNLPMTVRYAEVLLGLSDATTAHRILLDLFNIVAPSPDQIRLTAMAASAAGDTGDAYFYMSEYHIANADLPMAETQLDLALAAPALTEVQRKRFEARRQEIRDYLKENKRRNRPTVSSTPKDPHSHTP